MFSPPTGQFQATRPTATGRGLTDCPRHPTRRGEGQRQLRHRPGKLKGAWGLLKGVSLVTLPGWEQPGDRGRV